MFCKRPFSTLFILFHSTSKRLTYGINKDRYWPFYINVKLKQDIFFIFNRKTKKWTKNFLINLNDSITVLWCMATCIYRYIQVCLFRIRSSDFKVSKVVCFSIIANSYRFDCIRFFLFLYKAHVYIFFLTCLHRCEMKVVLR